MDRIYVMQLVRSFQTGMMTRRQFLSRATTALGSAAAASLLLTACGETTSPPPPVLDEEASTGGEEAAPAEGLLTETISYPDADGETLMGYLARSEGAEAQAAVIVIQEWWGLNEHIKEVARRFAGEGFVALAPDLYHGEVVTEPDEARKLVMALDMEAAVGEIRQAIDFLQQQEYVSAAKVGVVGFCMGGGLSLQTARAEEDLGAAIVFYGRPLDAEQAKEVKAPILGLYGSKDGGIPVESVETMQSALNEAGIENTIQIYEGAEHAFFNETRQSYHKEAAEDAWQRSLTWFRERLV